MSDTGFKDKHGRHIMEGDTIKGAGWTHGEFKIISTENIKNFEKYKFIGEMLDTGKYYFLNKAEEKFMEVI